MERNAIPVRAALKQLGATVGGPPAKWFSTLAYPRVVGDRDIVTFPSPQAPVRNWLKRRFLQRAVRIEAFIGDGQLVMAASVDPRLDWTTVFILVVHGEATARHL